MDEKAHLESPYLHLDYDLRQGRWSLFAAPSMPIVLHATAGVGVQRGVTLASAPQYTHHVSSTDSVTAGLAGEQLVVTGMDVAQQIHVTTPPPEGGGFVRNACVDDHYVRPNRLSPNPKIS